MQWPPNLILWTCQALWASFNCRNLAFFFHLFWDIKTTEVLNTFTKDARKYLSNFLFLIKPMGFLANAPQTCTRNHFTLMWGLRLLCWGPARWRPARSRGQGLAPQHHCEIPAKSRAWAKTWGYLLRLCRSGNATGYFSFGHGKQARRHQAHDLPCLWPNKGLRPSGSNMWTQHAVSLRLSLPVTE